MKKLLSIFLAFSIQFSGCTYTYRLYPIDSESLAKANEKVEERKAKITLNASEEELRLENIKIETDSLYWADNDTLKQNSMPINKISDITIRDHWEGLWNGLIVSVPALLVLAGMPSEEEAPSSKGRLWDPDHELLTGWGLMRVLAWSAAIGIPLSWAVAGNKYYFIVQDPAGWRNFREITDLIDDGQEDQALWELNKILNESGEDYYRTIALYLKIKYGLDNPLADYMKLSTEYPADIYTSLAEKILMEKEILTPQEEILPEFHQHDGLFFRFQGGFGLGKLAVDNLNGNTQSKSGTSGGFRIQIGATVLKNLILYGELAGHDIYASDQSWPFSQEITENSSFGIMDLGIGLSYYFMPSNLYLSGSYSKSTNIIKSNDTGEEQRSEKGWGICLSAGKEWWVSANWGLGLAGYVYHSQTTLEALTHDYEISVTQSAVYNTIVGITFSATYH